MVAPDFRRLGAMLSLLLYVLNPIVLANGALMTADMAAGLFFFAATWAWWRMLHRFTIALLAISSLAMSGLFLSKMSAPLIGAAVVVLTVIRLVKGGALPARGFSIATLQTRGAQLLAFGIAALLHGAVVVVMVWGFHSFAMPLRLRNCPIPGGWKLRGSGCWRCRYPEPSSSESALAHRKRKRWRGRLPKMALR